MQTIREKNFLSFINKRKKEVCQYLELRRDQWLQLLFLQQRTFQKEKLHLMQEKVAQVILKTKWKVNKRNGFLELKLLLFVFGLQ